MLGHGSFLPGGDKDAAVIHAEGGPQWSMPMVFRDSFRYAGYVNNGLFLSTYFHFADASDGRVDGTWRGHNIAEEGGNGFGTTARIPYQTKAIENMIEHENLGKDGVPDLFYTNYKLIDHLSHI